MTQRYIRCGQAGGTGEDNTEGSGGTNARPSLSSFLANETSGPDTTSDAWFINLSSGDTNTADTAGANVAGFITTAANDMTFQPDTGQEHAGVWNGNVYRLVVNGNVALNINDDNITFIKIQVENNRSGTGLSRGIIALGANSGIRLISPIVRMTSNTTNSGSHGVQFDNSSMTGCGIVNPIVYDFTTGVGIRLRSNTSLSNFVYNGTVNNCNYNYQGAGGNSLNKNCLSKNAITSDWFSNTGYDATNSSNNAGEDTTGNIPGGNSVSITGVTDAQLWSNAANDDFALDGTDTSSIDAAGEDLIPDSDGLYNVTEDAAGNARNASIPSCGARELAVVGGSGRIMGSLAYLGGLAGHGGIAGIGGGLAG